MSAFIYWSVRSPGWALTELTSTSSIVLTSGTHGNCIVTVAAQRTQHTTHHTLPAHISSFPSIWFPIQFSFSSLRSPSQHFQLLSLLLKIESTNNISLDQANQEPIIRAMFSIILNAALLFTASAYLQPRFARHAMSTNVITRQDMSLSAIKPDLFSGTTIDKMLTNAYKDVTDWSSRRIWM